MLATDTPVLKGSVRMGGSVRLGGAERNLFALAVLDLGGRDVRRRKFLKNQEDIGGNKQDNTRTESKISLNQKEFQ